MPNVLVVDDEEAIRGLISFNLLKKGWRPPLLLVAGKRWKEFLSGIPT